MPTHRLREDGRRLPLAHCTTAICAAHVIEYRINLLTPHIERTSLARWFSTRATVATVSRSPRHFAPAIPRPSRMPCCRADDGPDGPSASSPASCADRGVDAAARRGQMFKLKFFHHVLGARYTARTLWWAAWANKLDVVKYLREHGCEWTWETPAYAAEAGNYQVLKYALENGCPVNQATTLCAAKGGDLGCLIYAIDRGVPVGRSTLRDCADGECVYYALTKGCPLPEFSLRSEAVKRAFTYAFEKLDANGFEVPGRAWFEEHNALKPPPRRLHARKAAKAEPPTKPEPAKIVEVIPADGKKLPSDWFEKLKDLKVIAPSVSERRKRLRALLTELEKQSENITYGLYLALTEELRKSYESTEDDSSPRTEWDDPELFLPMI